MDFAKLTPEQLNKMDKQVLITIIGSLQGQLNAITSQLDFLTQRSLSLITLTSLSFSATIPGNRRSARLTCPDIPVRQDPNRKTTWENFLHEFLNIRRMTQYWQNGFRAAKEPPCKIYKRHSIIPQTLRVDEHHVHVYAAKNNDGTIIKTDRLADVFRNIIATPSLLVTVTMGKYQKHLPFSTNPDTFRRVA